MTLIFLCKQKSPFPQHLNGDHFLNLPIYILISSFLRKNNSKSWISVSLPLNQWSFNTYRFVLQGDFLQDSQFSHAVSDENLFELCGSKLYYSKIFLMLKYLNKNLPS